MPQITQWLCKFCHIWNLVEHKWCPKCLARQDYAKQATR